MTRTAPGQDVTRRARGRGLISRLAMAAGAIVADRHSSATAVCIARMLEISAEPDCSSCAKPAARKCCQRAWRCRAGNSAVFIFGIGCSPPDTALSPRIPVIEESPVRFGGSAAKGSPTDSATRLRKLER